MKKILKEEINRYRELMGVSLLSEGINPRQLLELLGSALNKTTDEITTAMKSGADEFASLKGLRNLDTLIDDLALGRIAPDALDEIVGILIKEPKFEDQIVKSFIDSEPSLKLVDEFIKGDNLSLHLDGVYPDQLKKTIDNLQIGDETKKYFTTQIDDALNKAKSLKQAEEAANAKKLADEITIETLRKAKFEQERTAELAKNKRVKDALDEMEQYAKNNDKFKENKIYKDFKKNLEDALSKDPNANLDQVIANYRLKTENFLNEAEKAAEAGKDAQAAFWAKWGEKGRKIWNSISFASDKFGNERPVWLRGLKMFTAAALITGAGLGIREFSQAITLSDNEKAIINAGIVGKVGPCVSGNFTIEWGEVDTQNFDEIVKDGTKVLVSFKVDNEFKKAIFDRLTDKFKFLDGGKIVSCDSTPGLGVQTPPPPSQTPNPQMMTPPTEQEFKNYIKQTFGQNDDYFNGATIQINGNVVIMTKGTATGNFIKVSEGNFKRQ